ncbi:MAG: translocation and assembly module lipoprotein TamL [Nitritalea sp.]
MRSLNLWSYSGFFLVLGLLLGACSVQRFIPEDERLYAGSELDIKSSSSERNSRLRADLEGVLRPKPNSSTLGMRLGLWAHYKGSREKPGFINRFLKRRIGEEPVYFSRVNPERTLTLLQNRLENQGYFFNSLSYQLEESQKKKETSVRYTLEIGEPYRLREFTVEGDSLPIMQRIQQLIPETSLQKGYRFDLDGLKKVREELESRLKAEGYYNFSGDLLIFEADTNRLEGRQYDLFLRLKRNVPEKALYPYVLREIDLLPNFSVNEDYSQADTVNNRGIRVIQDELFFYPERITPYVLMQPEGLFSPDLSRRTSNRLSSIGTYRFVNIQYEELDTIPDATGRLGLRSQIALSPQNKRSFRAELQAVTKSNNFAGPGMLFSYRNRNLFRGGETFTLSANVGFEQQIAAGERTGLQSVELGLQASITYPRVLFPAPVMNRFQYTIPSTRISVGTEYQNRTDLYRLISYNASFGYFWRVNRFVYHEVNPLSLSFVQLGNISPLFNEILENNPFLRRSFEQQFILGFNYTFNYNQLVDDFRKRALFFGATLDVAGNSLSLVNSAFGSERPERFLGTEYARYVRGDIDLRYFFRFSKDNQLVLRTFAGLGLPLGDNVSLPFVKQYFSGGPNSVRAFRIRSLGPGTYIPEMQSIAGFFDQAGDIRLEGNIEYRFPLVSYLKGALFLDAGNVWLVNDNEALPGGQFTSNWAEELGVGAGIGLRVDIDFFVLRFDFATPLRKPWLAPDNRWQRSFDIGSSDWRRDNLIINFAIGYPF